MRFEHQDLLWLLIPVVLGLTAFFWWAWRKRQQLIAQFVRSRLLAHLTVGLSARRRKTRMALLVAVVGFIVIAIARPQWGFDWQEARQRGLDIVVAIDTSRSMLAADIPPNRLARAKLAALDLKRIARPDRLGLVAFAGSAFLQCPLSFDDEAFRQSVTALDVNIIPVPGSAIAEAIETARSAFKERNDNYKVLVLFTDGEDNDGRALEAAERAAKDGMLIFTIGVGTPNGELLRITDAKGRTDFVRDEQGNVIKSRLNEELLQKVARSGQGVYMLLSGANTMELLYERRLEPLPKSEFTARRVKRYHERYQWFLGLALVLLLLEMFLPERKRARRRATTGAQAAPAPLAKAAAAVIIMLLPISAVASSASALKKYQSGNYKSALREYERLLGDRPNEPRLQYNAGAAAFQTGDYERSIKHFNGALSAQDLELQQRAFYNLGNAQYRAGEQDSNPANKQTLWQDAIKNYDSALKLNPKDADAEYNRELVKKKLEELKKQQQQQNQNQKQENEKKDQDKKDQDKKDEQSKQDQDQKQDQSKQNEQQQEQQKSPDQKQNEQKKEEEQQRSKESQKQEQEKQQQQQGKQPQGQEQGTNEQQNATSSQMLQMTPEQAQRLLESMKSEEKVMIFVPQQGRTNRTNRPLKDW